MTLKNGFGKCSLFVSFFSQWMKRSKHGLFVFAPKKTLIWRRHCSIGQSCCSMTSKWKYRLISRKFSPFDKPIKSLYFRSFVVSVLFARFDFRVIQESLYQNSNSDNCHQAEWNIKMQKEVRPRSTNSTETIVPSTMLKRIENVVFENLLA